MSQVQGKKILLTHPHRLHHSSDSDLFPFPLPFFSRLLAAIRLCVSASVSVCLRVLRVCLLSSKKKKHSRSTQRA